MRHLDLDCVKCGACCRSGSGDYIVDVSNADLVQIRKVKPRTRFATERETGLRRMAFRKYANGYACTELRNSGGDVRCDIYDVRPAVCRDFPRGGADCLRARHALESLQVMPLPSGVACRPGVLADGTFGHAHVRQRLADLICPLGVDGEALAAALRAEPSADLEEEREALHFANAFLVIDNARIDFADGDLVCVVDKEFPE